MVKLLVANKADINAKSNSGDTPLHMAARNGSKDAVDLLLGANANLNAKNNAGQTPLDLATLGNHEDIKELLQLRMGDKKTLY
jgi:ankyrin repeat protein